MDELARAIIYGRDWQTGDETRLEEGVILASTKMSHIKVACTEWPSLYFASHGEQPTRISYAFDNTQKSIKTSLIILDACWSGLTEDLVETEISQMSLQPPRQSLGIEISYNFHSYKPFFKEEINNLTNEIAQRVFDKMCQETLEWTSLHLPLDSKDYLGARELKKYLRIYTRQVIQRWYKHHKILCKRRLGGISHISLAKKRHRSGHWPRSSISRKSSDSSDSSNAAKTSYTVYADIKEFEEFLCNKTPHKTKMSHMRSK
jgi:hypothetical protein